MRHGPEAMTHHKRKSEEFQYRYHAQRGTSLGKKCRVKAGGDEASGMRGVGKVPENAVKQVTNSVNDLSLQDGIFH
ncbi:hypothetical protein CEXT_116621 [Caerostris extrusa]|uniref:Uncharacterized protein n=1 Tax=Caerostris extrusa TaxID=172846 RepID=A0AAV4PRK3_CAEEX|nr:hypothetical protein CEXT_116621 [Caerostris extrusa]